MHITESKLRTIGWHYANLYEAIGPFVTHFDLWNFAELLHTQTAIYTNTIYEW